MNGAGLETSRRAAHTRMRLWMVGWAGLVCSSMMGTPADAYTILSEGTVTEVKWSSPTNIPYYINQNGSDNIDFLTLRPVLVDWFHLSGRPTRSS